jgi:ABC-2 type transport system permease protein
VFYWPIIDVLLWGLTIAAIARSGRISAGYTEMVLDAVFLWIVLWRSQADLSINFLEELWSENLSTLRATPLTVLEWFIGLAIVGLLKVIGALLVTGTVTYLIYQVNFLRLGFALLPFTLLLLIIGWTLGLFFVGLFLRFGTSVQTFAWSGGALILPLSAAYYPVTTFPPVIQNLIRLIPSSYVFEAMRVVLSTGQIPWPMMAQSFILSVFFFVGAIWFFRCSYTKALTKGISQLK